MDIPLIDFFKHRDGGHHAATMASAATNKETIPMKNYGRASHHAIICMNPDLANQLLDRGLHMSKTLFNYLLD
jgi:hypothetical protein